MISDKTCIRCSVLLTPLNWEGAARSNYVNKCVDCLRTEKREYHRVWRAKNPGSSAIVSKRYKEKLRRDDPVKARARDAYSDCRKRAIKCGLDFDLSPEYVLGLLRTNTVCPYFGWELTYEVGKERTLASLDRIDSNGGYTRRNVRVISYLANLMKSFATEGELLRFAAGIMQEHGQLETPALGLGGYRTFEKVKGAEGNR